MPDVPAFERGVERLAHGHDFQFTPFDVGGRTMQSGLHLQAQALWAAAILGVAALWLLTGQGVARMLEREARNDPALLTLGMTLGDLRLALARTLLIGGMVVVVALPAAVGLSPLGPFGRARDLEPDSRHRVRRPGARRRGRDRPGRRAACRWHRGVAGGPHPLRALWGRRRFHARYRGRRPRARRVASRARHRDADGSSPG